MVAFGPGEASLDGPSTPVTMGFVVIGLGTALAGLVMHQPLAPWWHAPLLRPLALTVAGLVIVLLSTELSFLQRWLDTVSLTGGEWLLCLGAALLMPVAVEVDKAVRRRRRGSA